MHIRITKAFRNLIKKGPKSNQVTVGRERSQYSQGSEINFSPIELNLN